jgi:hypothetical protein
LEIDENRLALASDPPVMVLAPTSQLAIRPPDAVDDELAAESGLTSHSCELVG